MNCEKENMYCYVRFKTVDLDVCISEKKSMDSWQDRYGIDKDMDENRIKIRIKT